MLKRMIAVAATLALTAAMAAAESYTIGIGQFVQCGGDRIGGGRWGVVADPGLEQVAEDVQGIGATGFALEEIPEQTGDVRAVRIQVQIGDEEGGHARIVGEWPFHRGRRLRDTTQDAGMAVRRGQRCLPFQKRYRKRRRSSCR